MSIEQDIVIEEYQEQTSMLCDIGENIIRNYCCVEHAPSNWENSVFEFHEKLPWANDLAFYVEKYL